MLSDPAFLPPLRKYSISFVSYLYSSILSNKISVIIFANIWYQSERKELTRVQQKSVWDMGSEVGFSAPSIPKFDGDYDHWKMVMENLLRSREYWPVVENDYTLPREGEEQTYAQKKTLDDLMLKDLKAKNYLFQSLDKSILRTITKKGTSKQLWDSMKMKYQGNDRVRRAQLNRL